MPVKVLNPGLLTSVQDLGRPGYFHLGIPISGAMDRYAMRAANLLVGNDEDAAGLEAVFVGPTLEFGADTTIAVTGGDMPIKLDGEPVEAWSAVPVKAGQVVTFDYLRSGARICIAFAGGIDVPLALGSRSTYPIGGLGGFHGRPLAQGDELPLGHARRSLPSGRLVGDALRRGPKGPTELRVLPGLYDHRVQPESLVGFFDDDWTVAPEADRMGYRFKGGKQLEFVERKQPFGAGSDPSNIVDSCYPYGSVQVPGGTEPIILHRDAVSGGGYFMIGTVISADMDLIGQLQPNTSVRFRRVGMDEALAARQERAGMLEKLRAFLAL